MLSEAKHPATASSATTVSRHSARTHSLPTPPNQSSVTPALNDTLCRRHRLRDGEEHLGNLGVFAMWTNSHGSTPKLCLPCSVALVHHTQERTRTTLHVNQGLLHPVRRGLLHTGMSGNPDHRRARTFNLGSLGLAEQGGFRTVSNKLPRSNSLWAALFWLAMFSDSDVSRHTALENPCPLAWSQRTSID